MPKMAQYYRTKNIRFVLTVDGYNDDPRDLYQIPEVIGLFKRLLNNGFISLLEYSTIHPIMAPKNMPIPSPGLGALEVWAIATERYARWFNYPGEWKDGEDLVGGVTASEVIPFIKEVLPKSDEALKKLLSKEVWEKTFEPERLNQLRPIVSELVIKNPPYKTQYNIGR